MRDLTKVWEDAQSKKFNFGPTNTFMVDSDPRKVRDHLQNAIVVEPYTFQDLIAADGGESMQKLMSIREFLKKLLEEADDVQEYLKTHQYKYESAPSKEPQAESGTNPEDPQTAVAELSKGMEELKVSEQ